VTVGMGMVEGMVVVLGWRVSLIGGLDWALIGDLSWDLRWTLSCDLVLVHILVHNLNLQLYLGRIQRWFVCLLQGISDLW
jgi:hypothetical protein